jgi:hypothetical protein
MTALRFCLSILAMLCVALEGAPLTDSSLAGAPLRMEAHTAGTDNAGGAVRISDMGPEGNWAYEASAPAVAYGSTANKYLVVWSGDDQTDGELEIYGQLVDAATGSEVGPNDFRISDMGPDHAASFDANDPAVVFNPAANEFLVVWWGDDGADEAFAIHGQRIDAATGAEVGPNDFVISSFALQGPAYRPAVSYNPVLSEYLIAWSDPSGIRAQFLSASGVTVGNSLAIAAADADQTTSLAVTFNASEEEYLLVAGDIDTIRAMRLDATGVLIGGSIGLAVRPTPCLCWLSPPAVALNTNANEYLIVWHLGPDFKLDPSHIYGQRLAATGVKLGPTLQVSQGPGHKFDPAVSYNPSLDEYLVVWLWTRWPSGPSWIHGQRLSRGGVEIGPDDFVVAPLRSGYYLRTETALAYAAPRHEFFIAWSDMMSFSRGDIEIFGRRYAPVQSWIVGFGVPGVSQFQSWTQSASRFERQMSVTLPWPLYNSWNGEQHPAAGDLDGDGLDEVVVGLGHGSQGWIAVFDDAAHDYRLVRWLQLPWPWYNAVTGAIWPAVGDLDGDGRDEIVAGLGRMGQGYVAVFEDAAQGYALKAWRRVSWPWFNTVGSGETHPAVVNIDGDPRGEIVLGLGTGGGGWLEILDDATTRFAHLRWLRVAWPAYTSGEAESYPAGGDVDADGYDEIVVGLGWQSAGWVEVFEDARAGLSHKAWLQVSWPFYNYVSGKTHPAVGDIDGDPAAEIILGLGGYPGQGGYFELRDDSAHSHAHLDWCNVGVSQVYSSSGATFPAVGRSW